MVYLRIHQSFHWRLVFLIAFFFVMLAALLARVFSLAIVEHRKFAIEAKRQHQLIEVLPSKRGSIFAQDKSGGLHPLAIQKSFFTVVATPKGISDPADAAAKLATAIGIPAEELRAKLSKSSDPYEVLAKKLDEDAAGRVRDLGMDGIALVEESRRVYPQETLAASLAGFVSYREDEGQGEYGIEKQYESYLKGERGFFSGEKDAAGFWVALGKRILNPPVNGDSVVLSIDPNIQFSLENELARAKDQWQAESAAALVLEPKTGRILAMASLPTFNPNEYSQAKDYSYFRAPLVDSQFELGSVFKPITLAVGINEGVVTATTTYTDPGTIVFGRYAVSNFDRKSHGVQTMTQVLEKSLNTGAVFVGEKLGKERFLDYVQRFGFGAKTGIDLPNEVPGDISHLERKRDVDYATASFGQGTAVTPLQIALAIGAIANHGTLMKPYVVEKIIDDAGGEEVRRPQAVRHIIRPETAETVTKMMVSAVRNGFGGKASVKGYFVAAKTGTAQIPLKGSRGYSDAVIHTFVGFAPAFDPKFLILLQLNKPTGNPFASGTLTEAFHNLTTFMLDYYEIPPDER